MARETCPAMLMITSAPAPDSESSVTSVWRSWDQFFGRTFLSVFEVLGTHAAARVAPRFHWAVCAPVACPKLTLHAAKDFQPRAHKAHVEVFLDARDSILHSRRAGISCRQFQRTEDRLAPIRADQVAESIGILDNEQISLGFHHEPPCFGATPAVPPLPGRRRPG